MISHLQAFINQPISIIINDISKNAENLSPTTPLVLQDLEMKGQKIEPNEPLAPKSLNLPLKTILSNSNNKLLNNIEATNLLDISIQNQTRQSVSFLDENNKTDSSRKDQHDSLVLGEYSKALDASDRLTLSPELGLSSSFTSSTINTGLTSSYSPSLMNRQFSSTSQVPIKVLHKTMTKGSKAMRIMGSSNTNGLANGYLKNCGNDGVKGSGKRNYSSKKQHQKRLFFKNGNINISRCNIDKRRRRYLTDIFTTLIDLKWRYNILVFSLGFFISWSFFAFMWYMISYMHGDLEGRIQNKTVCISGINGLAGAILFSIETQQTIGYGVRFTTEKCPEAILVMMVQSAVGVMIQSFMVGVVFAKLSRPKKRSETLMFSKNAVISLRDGRLCLICRVGDMRKSHIVEAHVRMYLIKKKVTLEGEIMPLH
ncbi:G -activated inward rectifier potassium channel 3-like, partial [Brachionus plicatilis]